MPGSFKLIAPAYRLDALRKDYQAMQNMIFDRHLSFEAIIETLTGLETEINALGSGV